MNNLKRKYNIYAHSIPKMNLVVHKNDRWRLVRRLQKTRKLYHVSIVVGDSTLFLLHFYEYALNEEDIYREYNCLDVVKVEEVKK